MNLSELQKLIVREKIEQLRKELQTKIDDIEVLRKKIHEMNKLIAKEEGD